MKMKWEEPSIEVQKFVPDEYVSACWKVACAVNAANDVEKKWPYNGSNNFAQGQTHDEAHCGNETNQWVTDNGMIEIRTNGLGNLACDLYTNDSYTSTTNYSSVKDGDYIYWTTRAGDGRVWHHQGYVKGTDSGHPNRS